MTVSLRPLVLPLVPVLLLVSVLLASWSASWLARRHDQALGDAAADAVFHAALAGIVVARLAYVAQHASAYAAAPWALIDVRDGGWTVPAGVAAASAWLAWRAWRAAALRRPLAAAVVVVAAVGLGLGALSEPEVRERWPETALVPLEGGAAQTLAQRAQGRPVVVNLWASWCGPCRAEMPDFAAMQAQHPEVVFVFINQGESPAQILPFLAERAPGLRNVVVDASSAMGRHIGSRGLPTTVFYDATGEKVAQHMGALNAAALASRISALSEGQGRD